MNQRGGVINIIVAIIVIVFVLLLLMNPIIQFTDVLDTKMTDLQAVDRTARDINGSSVSMDGGGSLGNLTMSLMYGLGFIFLIGLVIYIIKFGPDRPVPPQYEGGFS